MDLKKVFATFKEGSALSVEYIYFVMRLPAPKSFNQFVKSNKSLLTARIDIIGAEDVEDCVIIDRITEIVRCFLNSSTMKRLEIYESNNRHKKVSEVEEMLRVEYLYHRVHGRILGSELL